MIGYFPKITLPSGKAEIRKGDGIVFIVNGKAMAIDMFQGGEPTSNVVSWLKENGIKQIDLAVATHAHGDHYGGFYDVVNAGIKIKEFRCYHIDSIRGGNAASREDSDNLLKLIRWLQKRGTRVLFVDHGDVLNFENISWHIYRNQPKSAASSDTNAWEYVNNGSLVLYSPELMGMICGDGPQNAKDAIAYFQKKFGKKKILIWFTISHHGNNFSKSNAQAAKDAGAIIAYESNVEKNGPGTTDFTLYGARRVKQAGIEVWMQNKAITITADNGTLTFKQGDNVVTASIPYRNSKGQTNVTNKKFIDVSEFNEIDWDKSKSELKGVMVRCGLRGSLKSNSQYYKKIRKDFKFDEHREALHRLGIPYSVYYFPTDCTDAEATESAKWLYELVKNLDISFPIALDVENVKGSDGEQGRANNLNKKDRTRFLKIILDYLESKGYNVGIYASASWFGTKIDMAQLSENANKCTWVADWDAPVDYKGKYWLWQYGKTTISGCNKQVDANSVIYNMPAKTSNTPDKETEKIKANPVDVLISIAKAEVGYHEGANNQNKYGDELHSIQPSNMDKNAAWCDAFVDWCVLQMCRVFGYDDIMARKVLCGDFDDYTYFSINYYKNAKRWTTKPGVGYQIFFDGAGHTGIVYMVTATKVYTIEGNKSDEVRYCEYNINDPHILGYGMPRYDLVGNTVVNEVPNADNILRKGCTGKKVEFLQLCLGGLTVDGDFGWKTLNRVILFQKNYKLDHDGEVGPETWAAIVRILPMIQKGSQGRYVEALQTILGGLTVDGDFGDKTRSAVKKFQTENGLEVDGIVGPKTWAMIVAKLVM